jgi:hypothetical protein
MIFKTFNACPPCICDTFQFWHPFDGCPNCIFKWCILGGPHLEIILFSYLLQVSIGCTTLRCTSKDSKMWKIRWPSMPNLHMEFDHSLPLFHANFEDIWLLIQLFSNMVFTNLHGGACWDWLQTKFDSSSQIPHFV